jgi:peptidoglycan L-alanyl-D-glutamate endopeptidase CwlK
MIEIAPKYQARTQKALKGVHLDLRMVIEEALLRTEFPFFLTEGLRTLERQKELLKAGASRTMRSRHLTGHAVDICPLVGGEPNWKTPAFRAPLLAIREAAKKLKVNVEFGADWKSFKDHPHVQLSRKSHP